MVTKALHTTGKKNMKLFLILKVLAETLTDTAPVELSLMYPSPEPYYVQVTGPKAPWNQAVTTHEQEITRGTCRLSKDGSVGGPSLLPNNSPRCAANICAFKQQAEGS